MLVRALSSALVAALLPAATVAQGAPATPTAPVMSTTPAAPVERPAFEALRYREDWSRPPQSDLFDPLKHIALGDAAWLSIGGHLRARAERDDNFLGGGAGTRTDNFGLLRTHLHVDLHVGAHFRTFVEGRIATARGRDLPGGIRAIDRDDADFSNAFVEANALPFAGMQWAVRVGRQEVLFGRERIVSLLDWVNTRRAFQGAVIEGLAGEYTLTAFATHPVTVVPDDMNVPDVHTAFWGAQLSVAPRGRPRATDLYLLVKATDASGATPYTQRVTAGARVVAAIPDTRFSYELEGGAQFGATGNTAIAAYMLATDLTASWTGRGAPSLTLGADYSSGTGSGAAAQTGTWDQLYPTGHAFLGFADVLGRRNVIEERVVAQASATSTVRLRASLHAFQRASTSDAIYDVAQGILRASGVSSAGEIGGEADLTALWRIGRHLRLEGGVSRFDPGAFFRETGAALPYTWGFFSVTATF